MIYAVGIAVGVISALFLFFLGGYIGYLLTVHVLDREIAKNVSPGGMSRAIRSVTGKKTPVSYNKRLEAKEVEKLDENSSARHSDLVKKVDNG